MPTAAVAARRGEIAAKTGRAGEAEKRQTWRDWRDTAVGNLMEMQARVQTILPLAGSTKGGPKQKTRAGAANSTNFDGNAIASAKAKFVLGVPPASSRR